jgi:hypothetical protein
MGTLPHDGCREGRKEFLGVQPAIEEGAKHNKLLEPASFIRLEATDKLLARL